MIWNRDEHIGKIKDVAECRSGGSRDRSTRDRERHAMVWGETDVSMVKKSRDRS
jgi:hypothetical protein